MSSELIRIFDTTLRDGEQSPGCSMNQQEKIAIARQLSRLGVDVIEDANQLTTHDGPSSFTSVGPCDVSLGSPSGAISSRLLPVR